MKKILVLVIAISTLSLGFFFFSRIKPVNLPVSTPLPSSIQDKAVDIKASFTIITGNITRSFQAEKYHNKSSDVYIESPDATIVHVTKKGITWDDFFQTLPMKLTKECLITGDAETLCNGKNGTLQFFLNDIETPNLLDQEIKDGDKALIKFLPLQS